MGSKLICYALVTLWCIVLVSFIYRTILRIIIFLGLQLEHSFLGKEEWWIDPNPKIKIWKDSKTWSSSVNNTIMGLDILFFRNNKVYLSEESLSVNLEVHYLSSKGFPVLRSLTLTFGQYMTR